MRGSRTASPHRTAGPPDSAFGEDFRFRVPNPNDFRVYSEYFRVPNPNDFGVFRVRGVFRVSLLRGSNAAFPLFGTPHASRISGLEAASSSQRVFGSRFRVSNFGFRVSGFGLVVSGFGFWVSGFELRVAGFGLGILDFGLRTSDFGFRVSGSGLGVSIGHLARHLLSPPHFGLRVADVGLVDDFEFRVRFGFWISDFGFRVSGFGFRASGSSAMSIGGSLQGYLAHKQPHPPLGPP